VRDFFNFRFLSVVLIGLHFENATYFDIFELNESFFVVRAEFELNESFFVVRAEFDYINRFEIFFQNAFEIIDVNY
jgi:hypothetical protein